jgi:hypothetical protein
MPKKIRRSNNRLKKTNRKGRKTANRNRLRKLVGGAKHWVDRLQEHHKIDDMMSLRVTLEQVRADPLLVKFLGAFSGSASPQGDAVSRALAERSSCVAEWIKNDLDELHAYLSGLINRYTALEAPDKAAAGDGRSLTGEVSETTRRRRAAEAQDRLTREMAAAQERLRAEARASALAAARSGLGGQGGLRH